MSCGVIVRGVVQDTIKTRYKMRYEMLRMSFVCLITFPLLLPFSTQIPVRLPEALVGVFRREHDGSLQLGHLLRADFAPDSRGPRPSRASVFSHRRHQSHPSASREHLPQRIARNALRKGLQVINAKMGFSLHVL